MPPAERLYRLGPPSKVVRARAAISSRRKGKEKVVNVAVAVAAKVRDNTDNKLETSLNLPFALDNDVVAGYGYRVSGIRKP